jgi:hypothetical protein
VALANSSSVENVASSAVRIEVSLGMGAGAGGKNSWVDLRLQRLRYFGKCLKI